MTTEVRVKLSSIYMSITIAIIAITCLISWQGFNNPTLFNNLKHYPYVEHRHKEYHRLLSSGFLHGSTMHLAINMYVLWVFGEFVEDQFVAQYGAMMGRFLYVIAYLITILLADIPTHFTKQNDPNYAAIGASGGTSGIIMIFILFRPWSELLFYFVLPIPAIIFGLLYLGYSSWASKNSNDNIGHSAHFWGAIAGVAIALILLPESSRAFIQQIGNIPYFN